MEVTITQFRKDLFDLVQQALSGTEVVVSYKGKRLKIVPEDRPPNKLSRLTPMRVIVHDPIDDGSMLKEMTDAWERDWDEQF